MENLNESHLFSSAEELTEANRDAGWQVEYHQLMPGSFSSEFDILGCPNFMVNRENFHSSLEIRGEPPKGMVAGVVTGDADQWATINGVECEEGRFFVLLPGCELDAVVMNGLKGCTFWLPESVLFEAAAQADMSSLIERRGQILNFQARKSDLQILLRGIDSSFAAMPTDDSAQRALSSNIATELVALISKSTGSPEKESEVCRVGPRRLCLDRAREYIAANIQNSITLSDVCTYADVGPRTLQRLFQSELDMSPKQYLLAMRLAAARHNLLLGDPESDKVTSIALNYGFSHLGRFSGEYRRYFGETPSETLKRY